MARKVHETISRQNDDFMNRHSCRGCHLRSYFWGPIAGGLFAGAQGAGVVAGSAMAITQSAAMSGVAYATGAAVGVAGTAVTACLQSN